MLYRSQQESVKPIEIDYSCNNKKCTYSSDKKPAKDPFNEKDLNGEWL